MVCFSCGRFGHVSDSCMANTNQEGKGGKAKEVQHQEAEKNTPTEEMQADPMNKEGGKCNDKGKEVIVTSQNFGVWMIVQKQKRTRRTPTNKDTSNISSGSKHKSERDKIEAVEEKGRYEILAEKDKGDQPMHDQGSLQKNNVSPVRKQAEIVSKEFLTGSQMRKAKATTSVQINDEYPSDHPNLAQSSKRKPQSPTYSQQHHQATPASSQPTPQLSLRQPMTHQAHIIAPISDPTPSPILSHVSQSLETSDTHMVLETQVDLCMDPKPPDPRQPFLSGSDLDEVMAEGTTTIVEWGKREAPKGNDVHMA